MKVIVDSREPASYYEFVKKAFGYHEVVRQAETTGDYLMEDDDGNLRVMFERKSLNDLHQSKFNGRLDDQLTRMSASGVIHGLLITGVLESYAKSLQEIDVEPKTELLFSVMASAMCRYNVPVMWTENTFHGIINVVKFMEQVEKGKWMLPKSRDDDILMARMIGISGDKWNLVKMMFGPGLLSIAETDEDKLQVITGIGPKKAQMIKKSIKRILEGN